MIQVNTSVSLRSIFSSMASPDRSTQPSYWLHVWTMHCWYLLMCIKWFVKLKVYIDVIIYRHSPPLMEWHFIPLLFPSRCFCFHWISTQGLLVRISVFKASRPRPNSLSCLWKRLIPSLALTYSDCFPHSYSFFHTSYWTRHYITFQLQWSWWSCFTWFLSLWKHLYCIWFSLDLCTTVLWR